MPIEKKKRRKSRKEKELEYENKFSMIPRDYNERLKWMYTQYNITPNIEQEIIQKRDRMLSELCYYDFFIVLYEAPEGTPRPRSRIVNRSNLAAAKGQSGPYIQVYSITGAEDQRFMKNLMTQEDFNGYNNLLCTPLNITYNCFFKTPSAFSKVDTYLAEIGMLNPITKPDWDNIGKKYSDMYNSNIWLDDSFVVSGTVNKCYSLLPRVEIHLKYLNMLYNKYQYNQVVKRIDGDVNYFK